MQNAILWDNDGILVNSEILFYEANRQYFRQHDIDISLDVNLEYFLCNSMGLSVLLRERGFSEDQIAIARRERNDIYTDLIESVPDLTMPGIKGVLQHFAEKCRMAVVTSSTRQHFEQIHQRTNLLDHFELVVAAGDYHREKPNPDPYLVATTRLGVLPEDCIAVEDTPRGLQAANSAGIPCIVMRSHLTSKHPFDDAFAVVDSPAELQATLHGWYEEQTSNV